MRPYFKIAGIALLLLFGAVAYAQSDDTTVSSEATSTANVMSKVTFPVAELGNCESREACKLYCDDAAHRDACFAYAQKVGLMTKEKISAAKVILAKKGPGGCNTADSCKAYCSDSSHAEECLTFAQEHSLISDAKANLIKKIAAGEAPGACKSPLTCKMYCEDTAHQAECRAFAEENGLTRPNPKMASTSLMKMPPGRLGSSTMPRPAGAELHGSSTLIMIKNGTPPRMASSSLEGRPPLPPKPEPSSDNLGATVLKAFAHLLGF